MNTAKILLMFCEQNGRAILTQDEVQRLVHFNFEYERINAHHARFAVGLAKRKLDEARNAYTSNPSDENRAALDKIRATWLEEDRENQAQRSTIRKVLRDFCTKELRELMPPIILRAANALAWMAAQVTFEETKKFELFGVPYQHGGIVKQLIYHIGCLRTSAERMEHFQWEHNGPAHAVSWCDWIPALMEIKGPVWDLETLDPAEKRESKKWRNIGQIGNPLFQPLVCELAGTAATADRGKPVKKYGPIPVIETAAKPVATVAA